MTEQMRELISVHAEKRRVDPIAQHRSISRIHLRRVLLAGIQDAVQFNRRFLRYEEMPQGKIAVFFEDGSSVEADLLVAADGIHSRVRRQYLPDADPVETGVVGIGGKIPLHGEAMQRLPRQVFDGPIMVLPSSPFSLFMALWKPAPEAQEHLKLLGGESAQDDEPYLIFSLGGKRERFGIESGHPALPADTLRQAMRMAMTGWHPNLCALADCVDESELGLFPVRTSRPIPAWKSSRITLLGDAIHSMTPYRGIGGNIALKDAAWLGSQLARVQSGQTGLQDAVTAYENSMRTYAFAAVADSRKAMEMANGARHPLLFPAAKLAMRSVHHILRWKRAAAL